MPQDRIFNWWHNSSSSVVPKSVRAATQIKVAIKPNYPQYFAVITHNIEQHCGFGSTLPLKESYNTPEG